MAERNGSSGEGQSTALHIHPSNEGTSAAAAPPPPSLLDSVSSAAAAPPPPPLLDSVPTLSVEREAETNRWPQSFDSIIVALNLIITLVLGLAGLKYLGSTTGLFLENPIPAYFLLIVTPVFILILATLKAFDPPRNDIWFYILTRVGLASGFFLIVSSISIFFPHPYSFAPLVSLFVVPVILAWPVLRPRYNWIVDHAKSVFDSISTKVTNWQATWESCLSI